MLSPSGWKWRWRQYIPRNNWHSPARLQDVVTRKTAVQFLIAIKISVVTTESIWWQNSPQNVPLYRLRSNRKGGNLPNEKCLYLCVSPNTVRRTWREGHVERTIRFLITGRLCHLGVDGKAIVKVSYESKRVWREPFEENFKAVLSISEFATISR